MTTGLMGLQRNPFPLLGATVRDDRHRIVALAEERLLELDSDECAKARADLLNPRVRLSAEIAWLPGVAPSRASQLAEQVLHNPASSGWEQGLPALAKANLLAAGLEVLQSADSPAGLAARLVEMANIAAQISAADVLRDINEDRKIARFPLVPSADLIEEELSKRGRYYRSVFRTLLDRLDADQLVAAITKAVDVSTKSGEAYPPPLVDALIDMFEIEAQQFLNDEGQNISALIGAVRETAPRGEAVVGPLVSKLAAVVQNWDSVAQPIQLGMKARGTDHAMSRAIGLAIRSLAVDLFNEQQMLGEARRLTELLRTVFAELPEVAERLDEDADALDEIEQSRAQEKGKRSEWAREITYRAEIGIVLKDVLSISPDGASWKGITFPFETITRVRWGATSHSINGIPTGTTYTIAFGDAKTIAVVECRRKDVYNASIERLWKVVGIRLLVEKLGGLRDGKEWVLNSTAVRDDGISLVRNKFWTRETVFRPWSEIRVWNVGGSLNIAARDDPNTNVSLSYIHDDNVHVLGYVLEMALRRSNFQRLSDLLH